jgi:hypothetical protein
MASSNTTAMLRLFINDFDRGIPEGSTSRAAMVGIVQAGIDAYSAVKNGACWAITCNTQGTNTGSIFQGRKLPPVIAAWALNDPGMKAMIAEKDNFYEDQMTYSGANGIALFGHPANDDLCATAPADNCTSSNVTVRTYCPPANQSWDAMCCANVKNYSGSNSNSAPYYRLVVKLLGIESIWADDAFLDFGWGWKEGRGAGLANASTQYRYCGVTNHSGVKNTNSGDGQMSALADQMWEAYKNVNTGSTPPPVPLSAPVQLPE